MATSVYLGQLIKQSIVVNFHTTKSVIQDYRHILYSNLIVSLNNFLSLQRHFEILMFLNAITTNNNHYRDKRMNLHRKTTRDATILVDQ